MLLRSLCTTSDDGNEDNNNYAMRRTQQHTTQLPVYSTKRKHIYNNL